MGTGYNVKSTKTRWIQDEQGDILDISGGGSLPIIDFTEWHTKKEKVWYAEYHVHNIADGSSATFAFSSATNKYMHINYTVSVTNGDTEVSFAEAPTYTGGSAITSYAVNRMGAAANGSISFVSQPTVTDGGTVLETMHLAAGSRFTANPSKEHGTYWFLKKNTKYAVTVTNGAGAPIDVVISVIWHEHKFTESEL